MIISELVAQMEEQFIESAAHVVISGAHEYFITLPELKSRKQDKEVEVFIISAKYHAPPVRTKLGSGKAALYNLGGR